MEKPLISVIVPVYKVEQYLDRCLKSIVNQTYKNLEIILIDDGSPDNCPLICDEWKKKDNRIKVIHIQNQGVSAARNIGLDVATGTYIGFVDSDDWIADDMYELLLGNALETGADISHCSFYKAESVTSYSEGMGTGTRFICNNPKGIEECLKIESFILSIWNKLYKKQVLEDVRFEVGHYISEDTLFNFLAFKKSKKTIYDGKPKYYYFTRINSAIESSFSKKNLDVIFFTNRILQLTKQYYPDLLDYAERRDVIENILMVNSIITSKHKQDYADEYESIMNKLKSYAKQANKNTKLHFKYKLLLLSLRLNKGLFIHLLSKYLSKRQDIK